MIEILEYSVYYGDSTILRKLRLWKKDFRIHVRVLQVAAVNGHTAVEKELRKFLKVRKATCYTGVGYLYYGSKTTHYRVLAEIGYENHRFRFEIRFRYQSPGRTTPPKTLESMLPLNVHTLYIFILIFFYSLAVYIDISSMIWVENIGLEVSDRKCCLLMSFFSLLLLLF